MARRLTIIIKSDVNEEIFNKLEDKIKNILEEENIEAEIEDFATGTTLQIEKIRL